MNILTAIGAGFKFLFGSSTNTALAEKLADKVLPQTKNESEQNANEDVNSARDYNAPDMPMVAYQPGMGFLPWLLMWFLDLLNHLVDALNHVIRPGFFIYLVGGFSGAWKLPDPNTIDAQLWTVFLITVTFFFGARAMVKDIPAMIKAIMEFRKGK